MKNNVALKLAASTLVLGLTMVGCKPAGSRPSAGWAKPASSDRGAAKLYVKAQEAVQAGNMAGALSLAEKTVELSPRDAGYRMLLADLYLKNGRFLSAETAFGDVLALDPGNHRAGLSRVLAMIGQGKNGEATIELDRLAGLASAADVGLAYALAGQPQRAIEMLEPAAREAGATPRLRQNLALAYAFAGDWKKSRMVAGQDLSPAEVRGRLEQWAALANPSSPHMQVAALLGVTPVEDAGQPVRLALAPVAPEPVALAAASAQPGPGPAEPEAATVPFAAPVAVASALSPVAAAPAPEAAPVAVAQAPVEMPVPQLSTTKPAAGKSLAAQSPDSPDRFSAPAFVASEPVEVPVSEKGTGLVARTQVAAAVQSLVSSPPAAARPKANKASSPLRTFAQARFAQKAQAARSGAGRFVVQLGAYRNAAQVEQAWARALKRYRFNSSVPVSTTVTIRGKGTFHRLAVAGFGSAADANGLCNSIRSRKGACFVRVVAGDAPLRWVSRQAARRS